MNGLAAIEAHNQLISPKGWTIIDGGLRDCSIIGNVAYSPDSSAGMTSSPITATLTLKNAGMVFSSGWTAVDANASGYALTWTKTYNKINLGEVVTFQNPYGYTGSTTLAIHRIQTTYP
jgi:hypothetical protein